FWSVPTFLPSCFPNHVFLCDSSLCVLCDSVVRSSSSTCQQLAPCDRHCRAAEKDALAGDADTYHAATGGCLIGQELILSKALPPVIAQATVRRAGDRVLIDAAARGKEPRHEIEARLRRPAGHDHASYRQRPQFRVVRRQPAQFRLRLNFDQVIELV